MLDRKYKNIWLNNQYVLSTSKTIECPSCGKLIKKSRFSPYLLFYCNDILDGCLLEVVIINDKFGLSLYINRISHSNDIECSFVDFDYRSGHSKLMEFDISNSEDFAKRIELMEFYR